MKNRNLSFLLISFLLSVLATTNVMGQSDTVVYDSTLAKKLGADDYGMKLYVLVILKTGTVTVDDKEVRDSLFNGHQANISKLAADGQLIVAGPLVKNEMGYQGIFILDVKTIEEAEVLISQDPAISSGLLSVDYYRWYGSAALPVYLETHYKIEKTGH